LFVQHSWKTLFLYGWSLDSAGLPEQLAAFGISPGFPGNGWHDCVAARAASRSSRWAIRVLPC